MGQVIRKAVFFKAVFFAALIATAVVCLVPAATLPDPGVSDKVSHIIAYSILMILGSAAYAGAPARWRLVIGLALYGLLLEGLQSLVPNRFMSAYDALANIAGIAVGYALVMLTLQLRRLTAK